MGPKQNLNIEGMRIQDKIHETIQRTTINLGPKRRLMTRPELRMLMGLQPISMRGRGCR